MAVSFLSTLLCSALTVHQVHCHHPKPHGLPEQQQLPSPSCALLPAHSRSGPIACPAVPSSALLCGAADPAYHMVLPLNSASLLFMCPSKLNLLPQQPKCLTQYLLA